MMRWRLGARGPESNDSTSPGSEPASDPASHVELLADAPLKTVEAVSVPEDRQGPSPEEINRVSGDDAPARINVGPLVPNLVAQPTDVIVHSQEPYQPDTIIDGWTFGRLTVRASSVRGDSHRRSGAPRQDECAMAVYPESGAVVVAVADGVSEAPNSHLGASLVCRYAVHAVLQKWNANAAVDLVEVMRGAAWRLVEYDQNARAAEEPDAAAAMRNYATTLVVACITPVDDGGAEAQVVCAGDSGIGTVSHDGVRLLVGGKSLGADSFASSSVIALPRVEPDIEQLHLAFKPGEVVLLATDGLWDPLGNASGPLGRLLTSQLADAPPDLEQFGRIANFAKSTFEDDRTIVAVWIAPPSEAGKQEPEDAGGD